MNQIGVKNNQIDFARTTKFANHEVSIVDKMSDQADFVKAQELMRRTQKEMLMNQIKEREIVKEKSIEQEREYDVM